MDIDQTTSLHENAASLLNLGIHLCPDIENEIKLHNNLADAKSLHDLNGLAVNSLIKDFSDRNPDKIQGASRDDIFLKSS